MAVLIIREGPHGGKQFRIEGDALLIGREADAGISLPASSVSRQHARVGRQRDTYFLEDLGSRNGTYLNGKRFTGRVDLAAGDRVRVGEFVLEFCPTPSVNLAEADLFIREQVNAVPSNLALYGQNPAQTLQVVLEITQDLGSTLEVQALLDRLLGHLLALFPRADRGMVLLCEQERLVVRAQRSRRRHDADFAFSRTIVKHALKEGVGVLSDDVRADDRFAEVETVGGMDARSLLCVPLICKDGRRLGVIQLDRSAATAPFTTDDLRLLTTLALQVAVVLENVALHVERLREEGLRKELALAREIQQGFLPSDFAAPAGGYEVFAHVEPAREVSGDFYDFFPTADGRLAFFLGDVAGKGIPAALFMVAVRTLGRHLAAAGAGPAATLTRLNDALSADNPSCMFVTLAHGIYDPESGEVVLASGGHPPPLLRRADGAVEEVAVPTCRVLGGAAGNLGAVEVRLTLELGETLIWYTDGYTEAFAPDGQTMFGVERLRAVLGGSAARLPLAAAAEKARLAVRDFTRSAELQDDQTLFLLRRLPVATSGPLVG